MAHAALNVLILLFINLKSIILKCIIFKVSRSPSFFNVLIAIIILITVSEKLTISRCIRTVRQIDTSWKKSHDESIFFIDLFYRAFLQRNNHRVDVVKEVIMLYVSRACHRSEFHYSTCAESTCHGTSRVARSSVIFLLLPLDCRASRTWRKSWRSATAFSCWSVFLRSTSVSQWPD